MHVKLINLACPPLPPSLPLAALFDSPPFSGSPYQFSSANVDKLEASVLEGAQWAWE